LIKLQLN